MPKPIKLTEKLIHQMVEEFKNEIAKLKMSGGKINYSKSITYKDIEEKVSVLFTPTAYSKMLHLLMEWDSEIAWHGVGERLDVTTFLISDILVYPQTVTGSTVEMDTEEYANWIIQNIEDERFNNIIMQGHSHVNMGVSPSSVDTEHQEQILQQLTNDMFYIFMIWNKKLDRNIKIYDLANNVLYENDEIACNIQSIDGDMDSFLSEAKAQVKKRSYISSSEIKGYSHTNTQKKEESGVSERQRDKSNTSYSWDKRGYSYMDDYANDYYNRT